MVSPTSRPPPRACGSCPPTTSTRSGAPAWCTGWAGSACPTPASREVEVLALLARGRSNRQIAHQLVIAPKTAANHVAHVYTKIDVSSRAAATLFAGMRLYKDGCAGCHGLPGKDSVFGRNFYPPAPQFSDDYDMEPGPSFVIIKHGVRYTGMAAWNGLASDADIWKVVTFLTHVKTLPPEVAAEWKKARGTPSPA